MTEPASGQHSARDFTGRVHPEYTPRDDNEPDPGEVVWAWVPFEEDHSQGKDRPVVVIGRDVAAHEVLVVLMLSSKDHQGDRNWYAIGTGSWDPERRDSWVRLDRPLAVTADAVRREGSAVDPDVFLALLEHAVASSQGRPLPASTARPTPTRRPTPSQPPPTAPAPRRSRRLLGGLRGILRRPPRQG